MAAGTFGTCLWRRGRRPDRSRVFLSGIPVSEAGNGNTIVICPAHEEGSMKVRGTIASTPFSAKLTVLCWGALTLLVPVAVSACTSSSSPTTPAVTFSPSVTTGTATGGAPAASDGTPSDGSTSESGTPGVSSTPATPEVTVTQTISVPPSSIPPAAPVTGG